ncbi:MAG: gamma-glutamylcyclotransferase family protein [Hyphomonadaceae bacterium]
MNSERLFSYGTLQQENVQLATFGRLLNGAPDALIGFKDEIVEITDPDVLAKSGKRFHPILSESGDDADRVTGTVFEISAEELAAADKYEVSDYKRVSARLASGSMAWVYVRRA